VIIIGFAVNEADPDWLTSPTTLAISNLVFAGLLWQADRVGALTRHLADMRLGTALLIGLAQCAALIPGASRSGVTMTAARYLGF
jgi:undecaprenyl-diphosphatase